LASDRYHSGKTITRDIRRPSLQARLVGLAGPLAGKVQNLNGRRMVLGRDDSVAIAINSPDVSRQHAALERTRTGVWMLEDLGSSNGTFVNGLEVKSSVEIHFGDRIQLADEALFVFSHQDQLEDQVLQLQKMQAMGALAGEVAHDFKNMLAVIFSTVDMMRLAQGSGELVATGRLSSTDLTRHLDRMQEASDRSRELIERLLTFASPSEGTNLPVDFGAVTQEAVALCQETFEDGVEIITDITPGLYLTGDAGQVHQAVMNLLINARDAMNGSGKIHVVVEKIRLDPSLGLDVPFSTGEFIVISVRDSGPGMSEEIRLKVFEPFFTTKAKGEGTGLGLATVYSIASRHGGHALAESAPGEGATIRIFFPCEVAPA